MAKRCMKGYEALQQIRIGLNSYDSNYFTTILKTYSFMQQIFFEHLCCRHGSRCWSIKTELKNIPALKKLYNLIRETENKAIKYVKYIIFQKMNAKDNENQEVSELTFKPNFCTLRLVSVVTSCCLMECLLIVESGSDMSIQSHSLNEWTEWVDWWKRYHFIVTFYGEHWEPLTHLRERARASVKSLKSRLGN